MVKPAFIVPITHPARFGYQYTFAECMRSLASCGDLIIVSCAPFWPGQFFNDDDQLIKPRNFISNASTWYRDDVFDIKRYTANIQTGCNLARELGYDVAINASCNWYIPPAACNELHTWWEYIIEDKVDTDSIFVRYQLGSRLTGASVKHESVINLHTDSTWEFTATDGVKNKHGMQVNSQRGDWSQYNSAAIVDCAYEVPLEDFTAKMNYVRCYQDLMPDRGAAFVWEQWRSYFVEKVREMPRSNDRLSPVGEQIAAKQTPEFMSALIERELNENARRSG